jgi:hypothetical protein
MTSFVCCIIVALEEDPCASAGCEQICTVYREGGMLLHECLCAAGFRKENNKCIGKLLQKV